MLTGSGSCSGMLWSGPGPGPGQLVDLDLFVSQEIPAVMFLLYFRVKLLRVSVVLKHKNAKSYANIFSSSLSTSSSSSQNALHLLQSAQTCSQSEALRISSGQWHFADLATPLTLSSNHRALHLWLSSSSSSSAPMLHFSAAAVAMVSEAVRGGAFWRPMRRLKDRTAPPSLSSDHWLVGSCITSSRCPCFCDKLPLHDSLLLVSAAT